MRQYILNRGKSLKRAARPLFQMITAFRAQTVATHFVKAESC